MGIQEKLFNIQQGLVAPKSQRNNFGNYNYRSCEDILEAVKPLLKENKCTLKLTDEIIVKADRNYVEATATITDVETGETETTKGEAREEESKKGMDGSQITGASSSYARKYALNGLFCIDDNKDSDSTNTHGKKENKAITEAQLKRLYALSTKAGYDAKKIGEIVRVKYKKDIKKLTKEEYDFICSSLEKKNG